MTSTQKDGRGPARASIDLAIVLITGGAIGRLASTALLVERDRAMQNPESPVTLDLTRWSPAAPRSTAGRPPLLGFPNPVIGVTGFVAPDVVGLGVLAGARFASWLWRLVAVGLFGDWDFVTWNFVQSALVFGVLCPYCLCPACTPCSCA